MSRSPVVITAGMGSLGLLFLLLGLLIANFLAYLGSGFVTHIAGKI